MLQAMIASQLHDRSQPALTTFDRSLPETEREAVRELVKDPFILDFLVADPVRERDLSKALTENLSRFLRELGVGFAFVGAEVPIQLGDREFFVDLLFYHCRLHRYVVFELKIGRFEPEYLGKLNFYVQLIDDKIRDHQHDKPTLGILLVVGRDDMAVEVALRESPRRLLLVSGDGCHRRSGGRCLPPRRLPRPWQGRCARSSLPMLPRRQEALILHHDGTTECRSLDGQRHTGVILGARSPRCRRRSHHRAR